MVPAAAALIYRVAVGPGPPGRVTLAAAVGTSRVVIPVAAAAALAAQALLRLILARGVMAALV